MGYNPLLQFPKKKLHAWSTQILQMKLLSNQLGRKQSFLFNIIGWCDVDEWKDVQVRKRSCHRSRILYCISEEKYPSDANTYTQLRLLLKQPESSKKLKHDFMSLVRASASTKRHFIYLIARSFSCFKWSNLGKCPTSPVVQPPCERNKEIEIQRV